MDVKIIKKLGDGFNGTVYLIESGGNPYIYKLEKLDDFDQGLKSVYHRQIDFDKNVAMQHPDKFMTLKSYGVIEECAHNQKVPAGTIGKWKKMAIEKNKIKSCCYLMYSPVLEGTFTSVKEKVFKSDKLFYDMFYQMVDSFNIVKKLGYAHQDVHGGNIMYNSIRNSNKLNWYIIDYGAIGNKKYPVSKQDIMRKEFISCDILVFLWNCAIDNSAEDYADSKGIQKSKYSVSLKRIKSIPEYKEIIKYLPQTSNRIILDDACSLLFCVLHYGLFKKCLGFTEKKWDKFKCKVPNIDLVLYCIKHCMDKEYSRILKMIKTYM